MNKYIAILGLVLLAWAAAASNHYPAVPWMFNFKIQLKDTGTGGNTVQVKRGVVLSAIHGEDHVALADRDNVYQPLVLCDDLANIEFYSGVSNWLDVNAFCPAPGVWPPPGGVQFILTDFYYPKVRKYGCTERIMREIRLRHGTQPAVMGKPPDIVTFACPAGKTETQCIEFFRNLPELAGNFEQLVFDGTCNLSPETERLVRVWQLTCKKGRL